MRRVRERATEKVREPVSERARPREYPNTCMSIPASRHAGVTLAVGEATDTRGWAFPVCAGAARMQRLYIGTALCVFLRLADTLGAASALLDSRRARL